MTVDEIDDDPFDDQDVNDDHGYPHAAGWKEGTTSREAAETIDAPGLRQRVRACLREYGDMTTDECAGYLGLSVLTTRPSHCSSSRRYSWRAGIFHEPFGLLPSAI